MNRLVAFGISGWLAFAAFGACQGPDSFDRAHEGGSSGGVGGKIIGVGGHGVGGNGVAGSGAAGSGAGGVTGTGGARGTGGTTGGGGLGVGGSGIGGARGIGGTTGAGGTGAGGRGVGGRTGDAGTNCISAIQGGGYAFAPAPPCSACMDQNHVSFEGKCMTMIDCLGTNWPCTGSCELNCFNMASGSGPLTGCVDALLTAAGCGP